MWLSFYSILCKQGGVCMIPSRYHLSVVVPQFMLNLLWNIVSICNRSCLLFCIDTNNIQKTYIKHLRWQSPLWENTRIKWSPEIQFSFSSWNNYTIFSNYVLALFCWAYFFEPSRSHQEHRNWRKPQTARFIDYAICSGSYWLKTATAEQSSSTALDWTAKSLNH